MTPEIQQAIDKAIKEHIHDGNFSQRVNSFDVFDNRVYILNRIVAATTDNAVAATVGGDYVMPFGGSILEIGATVDTAGVTGSETVDVNKNGTTVLSTKITIDTTEKTSRTAATPSFVSDSNFIEGDIFTFDIDAIQTTAAKGLTIFIVAQINTP